MKHIITPHTLPKPLLNKNEVPYLVDGNPYIGNDEDFILNPCKFEVDDDYTSCEIIESDLPLICSKCGEDTFKVTKPESYSTVVECISCGVKTEVHSG